MGTLVPGPCGILWPDDPYSISDLSNPFEQQHGPLGGGRSAIDRKIDDVERLRLEGDFVGALQAIKGLVQAHPKNARAVNEKGVCLRLVGEPVKAVLEFRRALRLAPQSPGILANLGNCLRSQGELDGALRAFQKALDLRPEFAPVLAELGEIHHELGDLSRAIESYEKSLTFNSGNPTTLANLASVCAEAGMAKKALESAESCLALDPLERRALVVRSMALHELARDEDAAELFNLDWIREFQLDSFDGLEDIAALNLALSEHVTGHPTLEYEPANRSTTHGEQTGELLGEPAGPVAVLERVIKDCVQRFLDELPADAAHHYLGHRPERLRWNLWGTRLGATGRQAAHFHPGGWVSGVYYAQLPPEMSSGEGGQAGWIEFGAAPDSWKLERERPLRLIEPKEGSLVLFPSYFYHRTLPFESETRRISLAFDAIPD